MSKESKISVDLEELNALLKGLGGDMYVKVGILGNNAVAPVEGQESLSMAELGVIQEFGSQSGQIPPRSFLRMPLEFKQEQLVQGLGKASIMQDVQKGNVKGVFSKLGLIAESIIHDAFSSAGFGMWEANAPSTIAAKGSSAPLIDTGALRRSITSEVARKGESNA